MKLKTFTFSLMAFVYITDGANNVTSTVIRNRALCHGVDA